MSYTTATPTFQSTLPARGATLALSSTLGEDRKISIHAPRTGSDQCARPLCFPRHSHFNPRSPHGERRNNQLLLHDYAEISIHAPRTGSDGILTRLSVHG